VASTSDRKDALRRFVAAALADDDITIAPASADASFRSYWRVDGAQGTYIVMDAPPDKEDIGRWLDIAARLRGAGLHAPGVLDVDREGGFVLMEDLGTRIYLPELNDTNADALYADALDALARMQAKGDTTGLPRYDRALLVAEMERLAEWFLQRHLGFTPDCEERDVIEAAFAFIARAALEQPHAFVHRDYHSRNLLILDADGPGVVDFQDAVLGPVTYDLVSLLRDCYIEWERERVESWMESHRLRLRHAHVIGAEVDGARFRRWFDLIGLQRHLKVLGNFTRLWYRDGKAQYLADLPLVWRYAITVARDYAELVEFVALLERALDGRELTQPRNVAAGA
jgi:aminoglycoside/choline kinase family phosphotransferase